MKLVFFGEDSFSSKLLESLVSEKHEVVGVFCPIYNNNIFSRLKLLCDNYKIPFFRIEDINSEIVEKQILFLNPELIVVCHFQRILKKNIINIPILGCINLHPSLLPEYRGMSPQHWPIINGDSETGITIHFINESIDTGDIILQERIEISNEMYVYELQKKMLELYGSLMISAIKKISEEKSILIKQDINEGSYYGRLKESQCNIEIEKGIEMAYNLIRGVSMPYIGAQLEGYKIWKSRRANIDILNKIQNEYYEIGIHFGTEFGDFIKFSDGVLIIEKYNLIKK
jgi:methionyl-tRNA formyltransferase